MKRKYLHQLLIAIDQLLNTLLAGYADETLSSRAYRSQHDKLRWKIVRIILDGLFFWEKEHCKNAFISELKQGHLPSIFGLRDIGNNHET